MILMSLGFRICHLESTRLMIKEGASPRVGAGEPQTSTAQSSARDTGQCVAASSGYTLVTATITSPGCQKETGLGTVG